jgi:hypothetical protein
MGSMPRARSILSATCSAASNSVIPFSCIN